MSRKLVTIRRPALLGMAVRTGNALRPIVQEVDHALPDIFAVTVSALRNATERVEETINAPTAQPAWTGSVKKFP